MKPYNAEDALEASGPNLPVAVTVARNIYEDFQYESHNITEDHKRHFFEISSQLRH